VSILIVGAGAAGGYIGAELVAAGRDVTFLVHPRTLARLRSDGLRVRRGDDIQTTGVNAVGATELRGRYDVIVVAVRTDAVEAAVGDIRDAVGPATRIIPIMNGIRHESLLTAAFGQDRVLGAATRLVASLLPDGTINVVVAGIDMQIGQLDGARSDALDRTAAALDVPGITVTVRDDIIAAMWEKFAFIASTAVLTCLVGDEIGPIARAEGGIDLARAVLAEVAAVAAAEGYALSGTVRAGLDSLLTDPSSAFGPSMFRDMSAGRPIEVTVLRDLADHARQHRIDTPRLDASMVVIDVHNRRIANASPTG
jgi:2-dehydropantoate 2-reductase